VELVLATPSSQVQIRDGAVDHSGTNGLTMNTAADGKFEFAPQVDSFVVLVISDDGYAEVTQEQLKASSDVRLQPWGKVVGKLKRGSKPWPDQTMQMDYDWRYDPRRHGFSHSTRRRRIRMAISLLSARSRRRREWAGNWFCGAVADRALIPIPMRKKLR